MNKVAIPFAGQLVSMLRNLSNLRKENGRCRNPLCGSVSFHWYGETTFNLIKENVAIPFAGQLVSIKHKQSLLNR